MCQETICERANGESQSACYCKKHVPAGEVKSEEEKISRLVPTVVIYLRHSDVAQRASSFICEWVSARKACVRLPQRVADSFPHVELVVSELSIRATHVRVQAFTVVVVTSRKRCQALGE